ncbi:hypothetical protein IQ07DRAFT_650859 [Pyrenochaeta sp. DS3sAY3a]|nr:hypothetical protein IQ07DRAFT_650859 [Pyrenochaeta sp. DS3sAY3a]
MSSEIALLSPDVWKDVQFEQSMTRAGSTVLHLPKPKDITTTFRAELNQTLVQPVQRMVKEVAKARIRKPTPEEYELPPAVLQATSWLELLENEIAIIQTFHNPKNDAKLQLQSKQTTEKCETEMQYGAVILLFGPARLLSEPPGSPYLLQKLLIEPTEE